VEEIIRARTAASDAEYITYCANCREFFRSAGKASRHILEILFAGGVDNRCNANYGGGANSASGASGAYDAGRAKDASRANDADRAKDADGTVKTCPPNLPDLSRHRENRRMLKSKFLGESRTPRTPPPVGVKIPPAMKEKMARLLLLDEDVTNVISFCEGQGRKLLDEKSGHYIGYLKIRVLTIWVEYEMADEANAVLHNVYTHRMEIKDDKRI
jgi:hypothetical protein